MTRGMAVFFFSYFALKKGLNLFYGLRSLEKNPLPCEGSDLTRKRIFLLSSVVGRCSFSRGKWLGLLDANSSVHMVVVVLCSTP